MLARSARDPGWRKRLPERWGADVPAAPAGGVWLHGSSLGEVGALLVLAEELARRRPDLPLLLTAFTPAGSARSASWARKPRRMPGVSARSVTMAWTCG